MSDVSPFLSTGAALFVLLVSAALTVPTSLLLLWLYRRAMLAAMRGRAATGGPTEFPAPAAVGPRRPGEALAMDVIEPGSRREVPMAAEPVLRRALRGPWVSASIYGVAGLGYAVVMTIVWFLAGGIEVDPLRTLVATWVHAWAIVLTVNLVTAAGWRAQARNIALYVAGLASLAQGYWSEAAILWVGRAGLPTMFLLAFLNGKLRAVGPLVFAFMIVGVTGAQLATALVATERGMRAVVDLAVALKADAVLLFFGLLLLAFAVFGVLGWWVLGWIRRCYERKQISDQALIVDSIWLIFTLTASLFLASEGIGWVAVALAGFAAYKVLSVAGFSVVGRRAGERENHRLLLLRVFGSRGRSERLMALVGSRWRYAGSIQLIAGTDLAVANLEPHEFLDFLRGKLANRYIQSRDVLERHVGEMDLRPDVDGRFRVNEFFCHDDTWRITLSRLAACNDAVLMDLRGFSPANQGCVFELQELVNIVPLRKVVLIVDRTTDVAFLREILDHAWAVMPATSPNRRLCPAHVAVCRLTRDDMNGARLLLATLAEAAVSGDGARAGEPVAATGPAATTAAEERTAAPPLPGG